MESLVIDSNRGAHQGPSIGLSGKAGKIIAGIDGDQLVVEFIGPDGLGSTIAVAEFVPDGLADLSPDATVNVFTYTVASEEPASETHVSLDRKDMLMKSRFE